MDLLRKDTRKGCFHALINLARSQTLVRLRLTFSTKGKTTNQSLRYYTPTTITMMKQASATTVLLFLMSCMMFAVPIAARPPVDTTPIVCVDDDDDNGFCLADGMRCHDDLDCCNL